VLLALWSPKGGSGTSVLAAACALVLARHGGARLADLDGDQPAIFGLAADPTTGLFDWLAAGPEAPSDALERLAVPAAPGVVLLPRGEDRPLAPMAAAEAGAALAVCLRDGSVPTLVDAGTGAAPAVRALVEVADASVIVVRGCYLALRRAVHSPLHARAAGVVLVDEQGRSLGANEVRDVLDRPVLARIPVRAPIARAVDAGILASRLPDPLARPAARLVGRLGLLADHRGEAA
jgi:MinD-like ATPase involved in chromosome partitioning or flagellar assembly